MNANEVLAAAKEQTDPQLWPWIEEEFEVFDPEDLLSHDDPVRLLTDIAQEAAQRDDWIRPDVAERERKEQEAEELAAYTAAKNAFDADYRALREYLESLDGWTLKEDYVSASSNSGYFTLECDADAYGNGLEIRLSDHAAPEFGGWNERTQSTHGRADVEIQVGQDVRRIAAEAIAAFRPETD